MPILDLMTPVILMMIYAQKEKNHFIKRI